MCIISMIGDNWRDNSLPNWPLPVQQYATSSDIAVVQKAFDEYKRKNDAEVKRLKEEMEALKKLLLAAKEYDEATGQPDCELDEKVAVIKKVAELLNVDMSEVFKQ